MLKLAVIDANEHANRQYAGQAVSVVAEVWSPDDDEWRTHAVLADAAAPGRATAAALITAELRDQRRRFTRALVAAARA